MTTAEHGPRPPHVHTIPVDDSFPATPEGTLDAFRELCIFGRRVTFTGGERWANVTCHGGCENIEHEATA